MFVDSVYRNRRTQLKNLVGKGIIWLQGNQEIGMNYAHNPFPFRQDSNILYYTGIDIPNIHLIIDIDSDQEYMVGNDLTLDQTIWVGDLPTMQSHATAAGIENILTLSEFEDKIAQARIKQQIIHTIPGYHGYHSEFIQNLLSPKHEISLSLIEAIVKQRSIKEDREIWEMEDALSLTAKAHAAIRGHAQSGNTEQYILGKVMEVIISEGGRLAYPAILTVHGEILHTHSYNNELAPDHLLLCDVGAENVMHYASDITRTIPVDQEFSPQQKEVYDLVCMAKQSAIDALGPGILFKDIHLLAAKILAKGLVDIGLMKGDPEEIVSAGAHALFFPHGLGHMIGLDVHDMEGLGERYVGYNKITQPSDQFGLNHLRHGRALEVGNVITVEPGLYFIPQLMDAWSADKKFESFINYSALTQWRNFGGIRQEDNILITKKLPQKLGPNIPE